MLIKKYKVKEKLNDPLANKYHVSFSTVVDLLNREQSVFLLPGRSRSSHVTGMFVKSVGFVSRITVK